MLNEVYTIGECLIDFIPEETGIALKDVKGFKRAPGGAPANVAVSVSKLGVNSKFIGKIGNDSFGDFLIQTLEDEGVGTSCISKTSEAKTSLAFVSLRKDGERDFMFYRNPSADMLITSDEINKDWFKKGDILHLGSISLIQDPSKSATESAIKYARENGSLISFDPNVRMPLWSSESYARETILKYLPYADLVKISDDELKFLTGGSDDSAVKKLFKGNVKLILLTCGKYGSTAYTQDKKIESKGFSVKAIDATGAGDAFAAGILYEFIKEGVNIDNFEKYIEDEKFLKDILIFGNANGALTTTKHGAISALPTLLEITKFINKQSENKDSIMKRANAAAWKDYDKVSKSPYRLNYHVIPPTGWMNDPNGLIQFKGNYHMFYQFNPYSPEWGPMYWGHVVSRDLVHFEYKPIAIAPDNNFESGCFSGSAVDNNGVLTLIYTSHDDTRDPKENQCIASSTDGVNFKKYEGNPVISRPPKDASSDFRDPKVWKHNELWYMVVGSGKHGRGRALLYSSHDLKKWNYLGVACEGSEDMGNNWECPNLFSLGDKDILMISPMNMKNSKNIFLIGNMDYKTNKFTNYHYQEVDYGDDFYAAQVFQDDNGRVILVGWMDMWGKEYPTQKDGWEGALTIPRELFLKNNKVYSRPVHELKKLRSNPVSYGEFAVNKNISGYLGNVKGDSLEIEANFDINPVDCKQFGFKLRFSEEKNEKALIYYDFEKQQVVFDKRFSGLGSVSKKIVSLPLKCNKINFHIFIDKSSVEVFINDGELVMSNRIYPCAESVNYDLFTTGGPVKVKNLKAWTLNSIWD